MSLITTIIDGIAPNPSSGLGGANEGHIQGFQDDIINGVAGGVADKTGGQCLVTQNSPLGMSVLVADGVVYVPNADYIANLATATKYYRVVIKAEDPVTIPSNTSGSDCQHGLDVVIDKDTVPNEYGSNIASLIVTLGTPGAGAPAVPDNGYRLAEVEVVNGATQIANVSIGDTRTQIAINDVVLSTNVVTKTATQTLTNKTLTSPVIHTPTGDVATITGSQTLTNKTLTSPVINTSFSGTAKASAAEVTTGTEDAKIVTPKALADAGIGQSLISATKYAPSGFLINGKIVPSVTSNNLTVAIKGMDGNDPSASNPVYVRIGDTVRTITAALSVTKNAGTNWFSAGSSELATKEIDYFVYLGYNATDGVVIGFARIPYAGEYSDFSTTNTNEKYCAISTITNAAAGDDYEVIGRFAATLSAGAGYIWSVPTFTNSNLIQKPINETRWLDFANTITASASMTVTSISSTSYKYKIIGNKLDMIVSFIGTVGGTLSYEIYGKLPFTAMFNGVPGPGYAMNSSGYGTNLNSTTSMAWRKYDGGNFTSGTSFISGALAFLI